MNKKEVAEIRRQYTPERCAITRIRGCYIDAEKNVKTELKEAFLKEEEYLQSHFLELDANLPFQRGDSIMSIAGKIAALRKEAIDDTRSLLTHDDLQKAVLYMRKASSIGLYAVSNNLILARNSSTI